MFNMRVICSAALLGLSVLIAGCDDNASADESQPAAGNGAAAISPQTAQPGFAVGRVTLEDGSPIPADVLEYKINIYGVSEAGEKVSYSPIVKNGVYKQKLVPGQYAFSPSKILVKFEETEFTLDLVPVGRNWNKNQDAADGIVQDFVWKPTGQKETYGQPADPNNHTHWHGMNFGMRFATYREDKKAAAEMPPAGSKLIFTLTPKSKGIDGKELQPITVEREWRGNEGTPNDDINDIMPANWEITGIIKFPDGTTKNIVFQGKDNYPNYVLTGKAPLQIDGILGGYWKQLFGWGIE